MSAYIPPALRNKQAVAEEDASRPHKDYSAEQICHQFECNGEVSTLNGLAELKCIILFRDQHPQWPPKVFCKSNLHLLPQKPENSEEAHHVTSATSAQPPNAADKSEKPSRLIPVFTEDDSDPNGARGKFARFLFDGMYRINNVDYLEPQSEELVTMLELKFPKEWKRAPLGWKKSLGSRWAVIVLDKVESELHPMVPLKPMPKKSVTEMLAELRLKAEQAKKIEQEAEEGTSDSKGTVVSHTSESPENLKQGGQG